MDKHKIILTLCVGNYLLFYECDVTYDVTVNCLHATTVAVEMQ